MSDEPRWIDCKLFAERGYIVATEKRSMRDPMREPRPGEQFFIFRSAYSLAGGYIDDPKIAHRLWKRYGIVPELSKRTHKTCSIGYSVKKKKWYGWSHRAIYGFRTRKQAQVFAESVS